MNFNDSESAIIDSGVLYLDVNAFANLSEIIALADGKEEDPSDNLFFFEPGRLLYNSLEFCNFVHRCAIIGTSPNILIRKCLDIHVINSNSNIGIQMKSKIHQTSGNS